MRANQSIAFRTAWIITGSAAEAEEAAQDAFLKAFRALGRFRSGAPFRPWLLRIVGNEARNRAAPPAAGAPGGARAQERREGGAVPSPESALLGYERRQDLLAAVERLAERDRAVIVCRYLLELSEAETAAVSGCARDGEVAPLAGPGRLRGELEAGDD